MARKSLALRTGAVEPIRPYGPGYVTFGGVVGQYMRHQRTPVASITTLMFAVKFRPAAIGVAQRLCGWDNLGAKLVIDTANKVNISVLNSVIASIGGAISSVALPAGYNTTSDIWIRGRLTIANAQCEYWTSTDLTTDADKVTTWTPLGTAQIGTNAGTTPAVSKSAVVNIGVDDVFTPNTPCSGRIMGFAEYINGVKTLWFNDTDIPAPPDTDFVSAGGGQLYTLVGSPLATPAVTNLGAIRSDFSFDEASTGLGPTTILGVVPIDHTSVRVSYQPALIRTHPTLGVYQEAMVVRSTAGFPATNLDGATMMRYLNNDPALNEGWASMVDTGLSGQQWYYYALFVRYDLSSGWFKIAEQGWLNPADSGYTDRIWWNWPDYYRRVDSGGYIYPGYLARFTSVLGYEFDMHRAWANTVGDIWDFNKLSAKMLPEAAASLGLIQNVANGDRRLRTLVGNLMAIRKKKGTKDAVEGYIGAQTGYPTRAYEGLNLLHRIQHTEFLNSFTATTNSGAAGTDNNPGWSSLTGGVTYGQLSRQTAAGGEGTSVAMPDGSFYLRNTNNTGAASTMATTYGSDHSANGPGGVGAMIPVIGDRSYIFSTAIKCSASVAVTVMYTWYTGGGVPFITPNPTVALATVGTTWVRAKTAAQQAPTTAKYLQIKLLVAATLPTGTGHINIFKPLVCDTTWRPEGIPSLKANGPLTSSNAGDIGTFVHQDYYEPPRQVQVNVYPNRTNLALNSDFTLNNLPAGAWSTFDAPTYAQLPIAYTDYADITDAAPDWEVSYADMAAGLYPLTAAAPTILWDVVGEIHINKTTAPYAYSITHTYFPATELGGMSAAVGAYSSVPGVKLTLAFEWYTNNTGTTIPDASGNPSRHTSPEYTLTTTEGRYELTNAQPPAAALYGRLILMVSHDAANDTSFTWCLIEDAPFPGEYFNGDVNDGDDGDFFYAVGKGYTGTAHQSPSVYYQAFKRFAGGTAGSDAISQLMPLVIPFRRSFKVVTAASGLYNVPT